MTDKSKAWFFIAWLVLLTLGFTGHAQAQVLPLSSPRAEVHQIVGITDIRITYGRPSVRGRKVWGELVPYEQVWRTGANEATVIAFNEDIYLNDLKVKAGEYALFTVPFRKGEWTVILNRNIASWGTLGFKPEDNVLSFRVKPYRVPFQETLAIYINNITRNTADLVIGWERMAISIRIKTELDEQVNRNITTAIATANNDWRVYARCAEYCIRNNIRIGEARQWVDKVFELQPDNFIAYWLRADLSAREGRFAEAISMAEKALEKGIEEQGASAFQYKSEIENSIKEWTRRK